MQTTYHLIDFLPNADVDLSSGGRVEVQRFILKRSGRTVIFQHPPATIRFPLQTLGRSPRLQISCGINECAWDKMQSPVRFNVSILHDGEDPAAILQVIMDPR